MRRLLVVEMAWLRRIRGRREIIRSEKTKVELGAEEYTGSIFESGDF